MGQEFTKTDTTILRSSQRSEFESRKLRESSHSTPAILNYEPKNSHTLSNSYITQSNPTLLDYTSKFSHPLQESRTYSSHSNPFLLSDNPKYRHPLQESRFHVTQSNPALLDFKAKATHPLFESRSRSSQSFCSIADAGSTQSSLLIMNSRGSSQSSQSITKSRTSSLSSQSMADSRASSQSNQSLQDSRPTSSQSNHCFLDRFSTFSRSHLKLKHATSLPDILSVGTNRKQRILILGLDGAGKSALFQTLRDQKTRVTNQTPLTPTVGYNVASIQVEGRTCTLWDVSGSPLTRDLWKHYLSGADCLIWAVDSTDLDRMDESRDLLHKMVAHRALQGVPLLVVANKQDLPTAVRPTELEELLELDTIRESGHIIKIVQTTASSKKDTRKLLKKLKKMLRSKNSHDSQDYI